MIEADLPSNRNEVLPPIRPLVIPLRFERDETLIGAIARSTRLNLLRHTSIILEEVGFSIARAGTVGMSAEPHASRLATKIGCAPEEVEARLHPYVVPPVGGTTHIVNGHLPVRWGAGALERRHLDLSIRRISPGALTTSAHHRWNWMVELLPYCLETLEPLVGTCGPCGAKLGWRRAVGIGTCESCGQIVPPSADPPLPEMLADAYRRFAATLSPVPGEREAALANLAPGLRGAGPTTLTDLVLRLGTAGGSGMTAAGEVADDAFETAAAVARGMDLLEDWPARLRDAVGGSLDAVGAGGRTSIAATIRKAGNGTSERATLVRAAVPEAFARISRALSMSGPVMLAKELARECGFGLPEVRTLEAGGMLRGIDTHVGGRTYRQYPREQGDALARMWRGSEECPALEQRLGIPRYAIEQVVRLGLVEAELSAAAKMLSATLRVRRASADSIMRQLEAAARDGPAPAGSVTLFAASRTMGGGLKNWGRVLAAMLQRDLPCWQGPRFALQGSSPNAFCRRVVVEPDRAFALFGTPTPEDDLMFPSAREVSQLDVCEILNCDALQIARVTPADGLDFVASGRSLRASLTSVLAMAELTIATPEAAHGLGLPANSTVKLLDAHPDVRRAAIGWRREDVALAWDDLQAAAVRLRTR